MRNDVNLKEVEKVQLAYRNIDYLDIPAEYVLALSFDTNTERQRECQNLLLVIAREFNALYRPCGACLKSSRDQTSLYHLSYAADVTWIDVNYKREKSTDPVCRKEYAVEWTDAMENEGDWVKYETDENGRTRRVMNLFDVPPEVFMNAEHHAFFNRRGDLILAIGHDDSLLKEAEKLSEMSDEEIVDLHRSCRIAPPFEPMHALFGKYPEYPEKGEKVWLRQKNEPLLLAAEYDGEKWIGNQEELHDFVPSYWQYRRER